MCGILGTVNISFDRALLDLIRHRGPDAAGITTHTVGPHSVILGHRRLAIVDVSEHGAQPMASAEQRHHLIFNGEIYNHADIRDDYSDYRFNGHSDTETLLCGLARNGTAILPRLNGIFAFAFLDATAQKLYLVRDPFGVKPLYYRITGENASFSSELAPLRQLQPTAVDPDGLASLLSVRFSPSPHTMYSGIHKLRPGHVLEIDLDKEKLEWREQPYVSGFRGQGGLSVSFKDALSGYADHFESAVNRQLMSDVEIGVLLSGGVDSALVAALTQKAFDKPIKAFTVGFTGSESDDRDEIQAAAETATHLGMDHRTVRMGFDDFLSVLSECVAIVEEPLATTSIIPMHFLSKLAGNHVKVVLSGQGADELLGGYRRYQIELLRHFVPSAAARASLSVLDRIGSRNEPLVRGLRSLGIADSIRRFVSTYAVFSSDEIERLTGIRSTAAEEAFEYAANVLDAASLPSSAARMMAIDTRVGLADDLLLYTDKVSMRESLECRVPFLDHELVRYLESLPLKHRVRIGKTKIVHKAYAQTILPRRLIDRKKKGFLSPTNLWFRNERLLRSLLLDRSSRFADHFDLREVEAIIEEHQRGFDRERQIFLLLCLYYCLAGPTIGYR